MKLIMLIALATISSAQAASSKCVSFSSFDLYTDSKAICTLVKTDVCARAVVFAMKSKVLDEQAMDDGVDLPESMGVNFLQKIGVDTYPVTVEANVDEKFDRLAQVKRTGNKCVVMSLYSAGM